MGLFFQENSTGPSRKKQHSIPVETLRRESCKACTLNKAALHNPKMPATGSKRPDIYVLGEAPGIEEDKLGRQFVGPAGKTLRKYLPDGLNYRYNNTIQCHPPKNRDPSFSEVECCRSRIVEDIERTKPAAIITTGSVPTSWALGDSAPSFQWRGKAFPAKFGEHTCWVFPVQHPSYIDRVRRSWGGSDEEQIFERDLDRVDLRLEELPKPKVFEVSAEDVTCVYGRKGASDYSKLRTILRRMVKSKTVGIDVETYPLRPYNVDSVLVSMSVADRNECVAFPIEHEDGWSVEYQAKVKKLLTWFLKRCGTKVCHNQDMEMSWLASRLGDWLLKRDIKWGDTMALAYVLDNRKGTMSLKFQCQQWLGADVKAGVSLNMRAMHKERLEDILPYNGTDSIACLALYFKLRSALRKVPNLWKVYQTQVARARVYTASTRKGVPVSKKRLDRYKARIEADVERAAFDIQASRDAKRFKKRFGRTYVPGQEKDDRDMFVTMLKRKEVNVEVRDKKKGGMVEKVSFDAKVLGKIDRPITRAIITHRQSLKLLSTYVLPVYPMIEFDGNLHATVNDKFTATSRTSYEDPNLQNYPRRKNEWIRGYIKGALGTWFLGFDYGQIEARVIAMLSHDKRFIHALWNHLDIHMDWTEIFLAEIPYMWDRFAKKADSDDEAVIKKLLRDVVKNSWVFPRFFGANDESCAKYMDVGVRDAKRLGDMFWEDFEGVKKWQETQKSAYKRDGYLVLPTGRIVHGPITFNEICNYPIQGTASEIQKDAMVRIFDEYDMAQELEIHDDLTYIVDKKKADYWRPKIAEMMCMSPLDFINVPLTVECKEGPDWARMEPTLEFESTQFGHVQ